MQHVGYNRSGGGQLYFLVSHVVSHLASAARRGGLKLEDHSKEVVCPE